MRLIDVDSLERRLRELGWFEPNEYDTEIKLKCILDHEPTAYDVDKVVEQLESRKSGLTTWAEDEAYKLGIEDAVKIVKEGREDT